MKVLLATDGSSSAEAAATLLARLPHSDRLELTIIAVTPIREISGTTKTKEWAKRVSNTEVECATRICENLAQQFEGAHAKIEIVVAKGNAGAAIVSQANVMGCELIVLGAVGRSSLARLIQGSVSDFVATHAKCSVLVVRPDAVPASNFNICIAYDDSPQSKNTFNDLDKFKWGKGTQLNIAHAVAIPFSYSEIPVDFDIAPELSRMNVLVSKAAAELGNEFPNVKHHVFKVEHLGAGLVDYAEQLKSNLIMLGDTGNGLISKFLLGSVSRFVLRHAKCSVWIARRTLP